MLAYLQKFNNLPLEVRNKVSDPKAMAIIEELEKKYHISLAALIMKDVVGEIRLNDLADNLTKEKLDQAQAQELTFKLKEKIFSALGGGLFAAQVRPASPELQRGEPLPVAPKPAAGPTMDAAPAAGAKVKGASFFFSPDDESEIRELTKKIELGENNILSAGAVEEKLNDIINRAQINFGSVELSDRFKQILKTYLRGIRNRLETRATLIKPFANGGLSFDEDSADKVMSLADKVLHGEKAELVKQPPKIKIPELEKILAARPARPAGGPEIARDAAYDFSKFKKQNEKINNDLKKLDTGHELPAPLAPAKKTEVKTKSASPASPAGGPEVAPLAAQMPLIKRRFEAENLSQSPKAKLQDVKYVPKVMGPLDEIKYLDLISFRRLDRDAARSADKIKSKIDLLAEENYAKKLEGVKCWRLSPLNKQYLEIGQLSIGSGKPIDVIIEEKKLRGEDCLTEEEFKVIMDLNKSLRF